MKVIVFDTETTWFFKKWWKLADQPYIIQRGSVEYNFEPWMNPDDIEFHNPIDELFKPTCSIIPARASEVHWIYMKDLKDKDLIYWFLEDMIFWTLQDVDLIVAHNSSFDMNMLYIEAQRMWVFRGEKVCDVVARLKN